MAHSQQPVGYYLLKKLGELYPMWVKTLNKDKEHKLRICAAYKNILDDSITIAHIDAMANWLKSAANHEHTAWPPQPLELRPIINMVQKKNNVQMLVPKAEPSPEKSDNCVAKWVMRPLKELPTELEHLRPSVIKYQLKMEDRQFAGDSARLFLELMHYADRLKQQYPHLSDYELSARFFHTKNSIPLMAQFGTLKRIQEIIDFWRDTQFSPSFFPPEQEAPQLLAAA